MKRTALIANIVVISAFFLVFLGMRVAILDQAGGPKPRPRAVLENIDKAKTSVAVSCEQQVDAELTPEPVCSTVSHFTTLYQVASSTPAVITRRLFPSRASPPLS